MKRTLRLTALGLAWTLWAALPATADKPDIATIAGPPPGFGTCCGDNASEQAKQAADTLRETFANYSFQEVRDTQVAGIFEVISDQNIIYYVPESNHLIIGEIYNRDGKNLTAATRSELASKMIANLPLDKAVKIGNGPNQVIEFSNPDCGFCRRSSEWFAKRDDVTRYVFLVGFGQPEPTAKIRYILSAPDRVAAYKEVMAGKFDGRQPPTGSNPPLPGLANIADRLIDEHQRIATNLRINGTPQFWVNGTQVSGAIFPVIESLLQ